MLTAQSPAAMLATAKPRKMPVGEKRLRAISEQVKNHLVDLGCTLLSESEKVRYFDWEASLPTDAGKLSISISTPTHKTDTVMVHGRFDSPELFPREFCNCNHINPCSGKWNTYINEKNPQELTDALRYFSRMIPILDATPEPTTNEPEQPATFAPAPTSPAPTPAAVPKFKRFPFSALRLAGHTVTLLHQIGKCAVARVVPAEPDAPAYLITKYRQHTVTAATLAEVPFALSLLRRLDNREIARENELLTYADAIASGLDKPCLDAFLAAHSIDPTTSYTRMALRNIILQQRKEKYGLYLSRLASITSTNPV